MVKSTSLIYFASRLGLSDEAAASCRAVGKAELHLVGGSNVW
jgi:hypothetical protein